MIFPRFKSLAASVLHMYKKKERALVRNVPLVVLSRLVRGGYLLSHFRSTIGVTRLNFSVRNGKRWDPRAMTTLVSFSTRPLPSGRM